MSMSPEQKHIHRIGEEFSDTNPRVRDSLNSSIQTLAEDLYNTDSHFLFELIQNAEDNEYSSEEVPTLSLSLYPGPYAGFHHDVLILSNNERGFHEKNVDAICAVGRSTKNKSQGYIGEKGIGFKSVFRITSQPHLFSNGYRFRLPEEHKETGLGYIVPDWIPEAGIPPNLDLTQTTILLPLDKPEFGLPRIQAMLDELAPETILFLSKLQRLHLQIGESQTRRIEKDDRIAPLVGITVVKEHEGEVEEIDELFLFYQKRVEKPADIDHEKRKDVTQRDVAIALPLTQDDERPVGQLFAYLPVYRETGLPFLINADFLLTSSREDVHKDQPWNHWLRECVAEVFVEAFTEWVASDEYQNEVFRFVPLQAHNDFVHPLVGTIQSQLKELPIIPTEPDGRLVLPDEARYASDKFYELLQSGVSFPSSLLETPLVKGSIRQHQPQLEALGVQKIEPELIVRCLQDFDWLGQQSYEWLLDCYRFLRSERIDGNRLQRASLVPITVNQQKKYSCRDYQQIFFSLDESDQQLLEERPACLALEFGVLDSEFHALLAGDADLYKWAGQTLGIAEFNRNTYAQEAVQWLRKNHEKLSDDELIEATVYLMQFQDQLTEKPPVLLDNGRRVLDPSNLVVPAAYNPESGWQHIFAKPEDRRHFSVLSDRYINEEGYTEKILAWFGAKKHPNFHYVQSKPFWHNYRKALRQENFTNVEKQLAFSAWDECAVQKREEIELTRIIQPSGLKTITPQLAHSILGWLNYMYDSRPYRWSEPWKLTIRATYQNYGKKSIDGESDIAHFLKNEAWLPTSKGLVSPKEAFLPRPDIQEILGETVPYFTENLPPEISSYLGINDNISSEKLVDLLGHHARQKTGSLELAKKIYTQLKSRYTLPANLQNRLRHDSLIFTNPGWINPKNAVWTDSHELFGSDFVYLEAVYPLDLRSFFTNVLGVKSDPDPEMFARHWLKLQEQSGHAVKKVEEQLGKIYAQLKPVSRRPSNEQPEWWSDFVRTAKIWTQNGQFIDPSSAYVPDDAELRKIFPNNTTAYVWIPPNDSFPDWKELFQSLRVPKLSESVTISLTDDVQVQPVSTSQFLTDAAKILILAWIYNKTETRYNQLKAEGTIERFLQTVEAATKQLEVVYSLADISKRELAPCFWHLEQNQLLLGHSSEVPLKTSVSYTLAQSLMNYQPYKELATWVEAVLSVENYSWHLDKHNFRLPPEVMQWLQRPANAPSTSSPSSVNVGEGHIDVPPSDPHSTQQEQEVAHDQSASETLPVPAKQGKSFPSRPTNNPDRRRQKVGERLDESPEKTYEIRSRNVRVSAGGLEQQPYLAEAYTNEDEQMICQICQDEMPFKKRDGQPYFEAVELSPNTPKEYAASYLALCPLCAAKYKEFIKRDPQRMTAVEEAVKQAIPQEPILIPLQLDQPAEIRFVETHMIDLQEVLKLERS